ncbi:CU044_5270 family protein [Streptosporangium canum]|uniref:CU044_5270 family protein n=1 Tax=Streptosporangium canum TaxID=324952 RepID=UPI00343CAACF
MNDLELVRDLRSEVRQSDPRDLDAGRERLLAAMDPASASRRFRPMVLRLAGVGVLGFSIVAGAAVVQNFDDVKGTVNAPAWLPVANAESLAERARTAAAKVTDVYPRNNQWLYTKALIHLSEQEATPNAGKTQTHDSWQKGDGKKRATRHRGVSSGEVAPIGSTGLATGNISRSPEVSRWDVAYLRSLPLDPVALLERLRKDGENLSGRSNLPEAWTLFQHVQMILQEGAPPPRLRAALYSVVSKLEGIGTEGKVQDLAGREGMGIYLDKGDGTRHEIIVDPTSYAYLGGRTLFIGSETRASHLLKGKYVQGDVISAWAQVARGIVDRAGDLP